MLKVAGRSLSSLSWRFGQTSTAAVVARSHITAYSSSSGGRTRSIVSPAFTNSFLSQTRAGPGKESSIGGLIRNSSGKVLLAFFDFIGVGSNIRAELIAILRGLELCVQHFYFPLWLEVDASVALAIISAGRTCWDLCPILTQIQHILLNHPVHYSHIFREGNMAADALANMGLQDRWFHLLSVSMLPRRIRGLCKLDSLGCPNIRVDRKVV